MVSSVAGIVRYWCGARNKFGGRLDGIYAERTEDAETAEKRTTEKRRRYRDAI
jgi:hypothetical protein